MMKHMILAGAGLLGIVAATTPVQSANNNSTPSLTSATAGKPHFGTWGFDTAGMDKSVKPGDSFFDFANGTWAKDTAIPADRSSWGEFGVLRDLSDQRSRDILEEAAKSDAAPGTNQRKIGDFYASFMDEAAIEAKGIAPLQPELDKIAAIATPVDLARAFGEFGRIGVSSPFRAFVNQDLKDNDHYAAYLSQGGLGLPDRDYYLDEQNPKFAEIRAKYIQHVANMLRLAGMSEPEARAQRIYDLEKKIAGVHWTRVQSRQAEKRYNPMSHADLASNMPGFDWETYLKAAGIDGQQILIVSQPSALAGEAKLVQSEPLQAWKDYLAFRAISDAAPILPKAFVDEDFAFRGKVLQGTPELRDRWKRGVELVSRGMGEAVGQIYVARYFTPEAKAKADQLVKNLIAAMDKRLAAVTWMAPETKAKARAKLAAFTPKIGYPDKWRDYSALEIVPGDALGNAQRAVAFEYQRDLNKLGQPVDRSEWGMTPMTVNAYANPLMNEVVFPAAILQPPFFDPNADDAVNYGGIGAVIGHELSHHFDDQGRKYDPRGNLSDWWTQADIDRFKGMTDKVVAQYGAYEPLPGNHVNGELTLGENMADLAGLNVAYDAYQISLHGKKAPVIDGYTGDQRFFLGFAQVWRNKYRDPILLQLLKTDPHTPGNLRPNVVRNFDKWYSAFNVKPGETLYLAPADRIKIW